MKQVWTDRRELLNEAKPHWAIGSAIASAMIAAYSARHSAMAQKKAKRNSLNAAQMAAQGGEGSPFAPTATKFANGDDRGGGGAKMGDVFGSQPASQKEQGFSLGIKELKAPDAPAQSFEGTFAADKNTAIPAQEIKAEPPPQPQQSGPSTADQIGGYTQLAAQLYGLYKDSKQAPQPGARPQLGPMNLDPTAKRFGV